MRTYDPADGIVYVHLSSTAAPDAASARPVREECHRLPAGYPNVQLRSRLGGRPALRLLRLLPGGEAA